MLLSKPTKHGSGILLYGDAYDLGAVYETIQLLCERAPMQGNIGDFAIGLAVDLRKAREGGRERIRVNSEDIQYWGAKILWPDFLVQVGLLRWAVGFQVVGRRDQSNVFALESCAEDALIAFDGETGTKVFEWLSTFRGFGNDYLTQFIEEANVALVTSAGGKKRFRQLPRLLKALDPFSPEYQQFKTEMEEIAKKQNTDPSALVSSSDFPKFLW